METSRRPNEEELPPEGERIARPGHLNACEFRVTAENRAVFKDKRKWVSSRVPIYSSAKVNIT